MGGGFDTGFRPTQPPGSIQAFALLSHQARYRLSPYSATEWGRLLSSPPGLKSNSRRLLSSTRRWLRYGLKPYSATERGRLLSSPPGLKSNSRRLLSSTLGRTEATAPIPLFPLNCDFTHFFFQTFLAKCFKSSYSPLIRASFFFFDQP